MKTIISKNDSTILLQSINQEILEGKIVVLSQNGKVGILTHNTSSVSFVEQGLFFTPLEFHGCDSYFWIGSGKGLSVEEFISLFVEHKPSTVLIFDNRIEFAHWLIQK